MFKIKPFAENQSIELERLKAQCETEMGWNPPPEYLQEWTKTVIGLHRQDSKLTKVAFIEQRMVGYCMSVKKLHNYDGVVMDITWKSTYIWDLFVRKECRNKGIGTALLDDAFEYLKSVGADKVGLLVNYGNEDARKLSEKSGFKLWSHFLVKRF